MIRRHYQLLTHDCFICIFIIIQCYFTSCPMLRSYTSLCGVITDVFLVCLCGTVVECMPLKREVSSSTPIEDFVYILYYVISVYLGCELS